MFPVGPESAKKLGYDASEVDSLPLSSNSRPAVFALKTRLF